MEPGDCDLNPLKPAAKVSLSGKLSFLVVLSQADWHASSIAKVMVGDSHPT